MEEPPSRACEPPPLHTNLAERTLGDVIESIASEVISPGAGAAGAVALALAAACAGKAISITLKRHADDHALLDSRDRLADIRDRALRGAEIGRAHV